MNLANLNIDNLDKLPKKERFDAENKSWDKQHNYFPYHRLYRWLCSWVGYSWKSAFSAYLVQDWIPKEYRTFREFSRQVATTTFKKGKKIYYHDDMSFYGESERPVEGSSDLIYVHPDTQEICLYKAPHINYDKLRAEEKAKYLRILGDYHQIAKIDGIWYEIKAVPVKPEVIEVDGLHYRIVEHTLPITITIMGYNVIPVQGKQWENPIGPKDPLVTKMRDYRKNSDSVRITYYKQLNSAELKKHGVKNDRPKLGVWKKCKICGGFNCPDRRHN